MRRGGRGWGGVFGRGGAWRRRWSCGVCFGVVASSVGGACVAGGGGGGGARRWRGGGRGWRGGGGGGGGAGADGLATLPKIGPARSDTQAGSGLRAGELVGPYRLIRPLGQGGMAEVWLAQRADGAFKREVALKLPMPSRHRKDLASRFARERDILAGLEHPNIARLYDAGVTQEGLPYLAM